MKKLVKITILGEPGTGKGIVAHAIEKYLKTVFSNSTVRINPITLSEQERDGACFDDILFKLPEGVFKDTIFDIRISQEKKRPEKSIEELVDECNKHSSMPAILYFKAPTRTVGMATGIGTFSSLERNSVRNSNLVIQKTGFDDFYFIHKNRYGKHGVMLKESDVKELLSDLFI